MNCYITWSFEVGQVFGGLLVVQLIFSDQVILRKPRLFFHENHVAVIPFVYSMSLDLSLIPEDIFAYALPV